MTHVRVCLLQCKLQHHLLFSRATRRVSAVGTRDMCGTRPKWIDIMDFDFIHVAALGSLLFLRAHAWRIGGSCLVIPMQSDASTTTQNGCNIKIQCTFGIGCVTLRLTVVICMLFCTCRYMLVQYNLIKYLLIQDVDDLCNHFAHGAMLITTQDRVVYPTPCENNLDIL